MSQAQSNGWPRWSEYVLRALDRVEACLVQNDERHRGFVEKGELKDLQDEVARLGREVAGLKVKAGFWGAVGAAVTAAAAALLGLALKLF